MSGRHPNATSGDRGIAAVLWDVDDTLFDHSGAERLAALEHLASEGLLERYGSEEEAAAHWHEVSEAFVRRYLDGALTFQDQRRERARALAGRAFTDDEADAWFGGYLGAYQHHWRAFPDAVPALDALAVGYRHGVLSNNAAFQQDQKLRALGIRDRFEVLACAEELGVAKPAAAAFHAACAALDLPPEAVAYVGDLADNDAQAADAAGLTGIWLDRSGTEPGPDGPMRITSLAELPALLAEPRRFGRAA